MSTTRTADEIKAEHLSKMGPQLGALYFALWQEVAAVHRTWGEYVQLFGIAQSRVELLNRAAPTFFRIVQDSLFDDVLLSISRLTDPPKSVGRVNVSLRQLSVLTKGTDIEVKTHALVEKAVNSADFCRDWRNRRLAHADSELVTGTSASPLMPASRAKVNDCLAAIAQAMNAVCNRYLDSTTFFEWSDVSGGSVTLLYLLDDGLRAQESRREQMRRGEIDVAQMRPRNL